ncbi:M23 family metallopeptidase [Leifsonia poae]|uniref:M23 family metallopeptidase n=1 Tax=Leifsonia poae TaxID=110933 RepID=UPI001CBF753A|nr:M23 family metallopeptidase [Leifsonia poae]
MTAEPQENTAPTRAALGQATPEDPAERTILIDGAPPATRRERRERERAEEARKRASDGLPNRRETRVPPLRTPATGTPRVRTPRAHRSSAAKGISILAMTFAATIAVATSVPAMALLTQEDVRTLALHAQAPSVTTGETQDFVADPGATVATIERDGAAVTSAEQVSAISHMRIAETFTNNPLGTVQWPFPVGVPISDGYGPRIAPTDGASTNHLGVDFAPGAGVPIQIIADGVVREVVLRDNGGCGVNVTIDHMIGGKLIASKYCHMQSGSVRVTAGQQVKVADTVGRVGNTGISTGAHLHFEILLNGTEHTDPYAWLKANAS